MSMFASQKSTGFGGVLRDSCGTFIAAVQGIREGLASPLVAEAIGVREILSWLKQRGETCVIFECDSQLVVQAIANGREDVSMAGLIFQDCRALLQDLDQCFIQFVPKSANSASHFPFLSDILLRDPGLLPCDCVDRVYAVDVEPELLVAISKNRDYLWVTPS
ncbi:hypothetical protein LguiA_005828 [Lonicera macranthoides]